MQEIIQMPRDVALVGILLLLFLLICDHIRKQTFVCRASCIISYSKVYISGNEAYVCIRSKSEDCLSNFTEVVEYETFIETMLIPDEHENSLQCEKLSGTKSSPNRPPVIEDTSILGDVCLAFNNSDSHMLSHAENVHLCNGLVTPCLNDDNCTSCVSTEEGMTINIDISLDDIELSGVPDEYYMLSGTGTNNKYVDATKSSSIAISESENNHHISHDLQTECMSSENPSNTGILPGQSASIASEKTVLDSSLELNIVDHAYIIYEEPTVTIEVHVYITLARLCFSKTVAQSNVDEALRLMQISKFSLYSDDRQRLGLDAISDIYSILRDEAARI